jgi:tRNA 2-selenouridine synthase
MEIDIEEALKRSDLVFIDVRSPGEYEASAIPGSLNIPLFDNREYRRLGIIYHRKGEHEARRAALKIVAPKLPGLADTIAETCGDKMPLLYCRRGGMRSLSLYQVLSLTGISVLRLKKGYKAYRKLVSKRLAEYNLKPGLIILHGLTGVGKTAVLHELKKLGHPILDLEGLAKHRGSVFGAIGPETPRSQKNFDALLLEQLDLLQGVSFIFVEGEGRRIGNIYLPPFLFQAMKNGVQVLLTASIKTRVKRIIEAYRPDELSQLELENLKIALESLNNRLGKRKTADLQAMLDQANFRTVAEILCTDYYDHYYSDSRPESARFDYSIDAEIISTAVAELIKLAGNLKKPKE